MDKYSVELILEQMRQASSSLAMINDTMLMRKISLNLDGRKPREIDQKTWDNLQGAANLIRRNTETFVQRTSRAK